MKDTTEGQNTKSDDPIHAVKLTLPAEQDEPTGKVNLTPSIRSPANSEAARVCTSSSCTCVTETTTTENTHKIHETTTGDVRSLCTSLGVSDTSLETFICRYGEENVHEKARLLEIAMQTQGVRNPTGWLHAALKNGYTFSPPRPSVVEKPIRPKNENEYRKETTSSPEAAPVRPATSKTLATPAKEHRPRDLQERFQDYLANGTGDGNAFVQEYLRRRGNEGRASP